MSIIEITKFLHGDYESERDQEQQEQINQIFDEFSFFSIDDLLSMLNQHIRSAKV
jgi:hypothetical protein